MRVLFWTLFWFVGVCVLGTVALSRLAEVTGQRALTAERPAIFIAHLQGVIQDPIQFLILLGLILLMVWLWRRLTGR